MGEASSRAAHRLTTRTRAPRTVRVSRPGRSAVRQHPVPPLPARAGTGPPPARARGVSGLSGPPNARTRMGPGSPLGHHTTGVNRGEPTGSRAAGPSDPHALLARFFARAGSQPRAHLTFFSPGPDPLPPSWRPLRDHPRARKASTDPLASVSGISPSGVDFPTLLHRVQKGVDFPTTLRMLWPSRGVAGLTHPTANVWLRPKGPAVGRGHLFSI